MRTFLFLIALLFVGTASAQKQSIYADFGGTSGFGLSYDRRFTKNSPWGFRAGLGYGFLTVDGAVTDRAVLFPVSAYRLLGNGKHNLELGAGLTLGVGWEDSDRVCSYYYKCDFPAESYFLSFLHTTVGYRLHTRSGFTLRAGINPLLVLSENDHTTLNAMPYLSVGYTF